METKQFYAKTVNALKARAKRPKIILGKNKDGSQQCSHAIESGKSFISIQRARMHAGRQAGCSY